MPERLPKNVEHPPTASDSQMADFFDQHILAPCEDGQGHHVGEVYVREAQKILLQMKAKPAEDQDENAIFRIEAALRRYREVFGK